MTFFRLIRFLILGKEVFLPEKIHTQIHTQNKKGANLILVNPSISSGGPGQN
jgi:hypothetical protein